MRAQYLLRFDDICPSMNWRAWDAIEAVLLDQGIDPILAVVPDNQDEVLRVSAANYLFWDRVREWQARGWTIGMHGWQHRFVTKDGGILAVNEFSEFAGLPQCEQQRKLQAGLEILQEHGIHPKVWIAPAHSFDTVTIQGLGQLGFRYISDGFSPLPHVDEFGMTWIPQQLWSFRWRPFGVWTICFHINGWARADIMAFKERTTRYRGTISSFSTIVDRYDGRQKTLFDHTAALVYRSAAQAKLAVTQLIRPFSRNTTLRVDTTM